MPIATPQGTLDFKSVDTITFVGASSNTVIDTTTGSLGVGVDVNGPTSNLHVVGNAFISSDLTVTGNVNMLHTSNTASIKLNSNVVTEFPRSKKFMKFPRVAMTGASAPTGYVVTTSNEYDDGAGNLQLLSWMAFDNTPGTRWDTANDGNYNSSGVHDGSFTTSVGGVATNGEWIQVEFPHKLRPSYFTLNTAIGTSGSTNFQERAPKTVLLVGSNTNNGTDWISLFNNTSTPRASTPSTTLVEAFTLSTTQSYKYFRLIVLTTFGGTSGTSASISELQFFGTPEYDPEADGVDVVVKSLPNVPNTDWLEVYYDAKDLAGGSTTVNDLKPVGTAINGVAIGNTSVSDGSFVLDGTGDYIRGQLTSFGGEQTFTFSLWFNMVEMVSGSNNNIFQIGSQGSSEEGLGFRVQTGSVFRMYTWGGSANFDVGTVLPKTWYHAVGTYSSGVMTLYVDGNILKSTSGSSLNLPTNPYFALGVQLTSSGTEYSTSGFNGSIANFRLFNRALTSDEIYQLYAYQKEYFGLGDLSMTLKAGRLGIGTSEPRAALDVRGRIMREYNPGEIIETIQTRADGQNVRVLSGTYSIQDVTSLQDVTTSHTIVTGSSISYKPPPGTTRVIYEFYVYVRFKDGDFIIHFAGRLAGTQVSHSRSTFRSRDYEQQWVYNNMTITIGDVASDNLAAGKLASWTTNKTIDFTCRDYSDVYEAYLHGPEHWDGVGTSIKTTPFIKITAIA